MRMTTYLKKLAKILAKRLPKGILNEPLSGRSESLENLFRGYNGKYTYRDIDTG